ncbi:MAG: GNAT family N-acetyltransferase [Clostridia bacterium]|nr:GNAT family N-acetyltransferase [Clostridia bacterium]
MLESVRDFSQLSSLGSSPYTAKIQALFNTYGNKFQFADFWVQSPDTAVCRVDGNLTIECSEKTDYDEIKHFLNYIPYNTISIDEKYCRILGFDKYLSSFLVKYCGDSLNISIEPDDNYKCVYNLLISSGFELGDYSSFLADFVSRINAGCAALTSYYNDSVLAATASALFIGKNDVLLGAVATEKIQRGRGYASELVKSLASYYGREKNVYLFCREDSLAEFYEKCGFCIAGRWAQISNGK